MLLGGTELNEETFTRLEYDKVKTDLKSYTLSYLGAEHVNELLPSTNKQQIERWLAESEEAMVLVSNSGSVPIPSLDGIEHIAKALGKSFVFNENDFEAIALFLRSTKQLAQYLSRKREIAPTISAYGDALYPLDHLLTEITRCIVGGEVADDASVSLHRARKAEAIVQTRLRKKLDGILQKYRSYLQEAIVMQRAGRYVVAVRKDHRRMVPGTALDESASGQTVFIEPAETSHLHQELESLRTEIEQEKYRVLCALSEQVDDCQTEIRANLETVGMCDFVVAKGKYARGLSAMRPAVNTVGIIQLREAKHPLLGTKSVPIHFRIGGPYRTLLITGPNTGGKTVTLKTVGLLTLMAQSGLLIPAAKDSNLAIFHQVWPDIGDGQSLEHSLSTFSAHVRSLVHILNHADPKTLVLLDELASGTDPGEGIGLSIAVLERLYQLGSTVVATTHFGEIKEFAAAAEGFEVARMEFDLKNLQPLYRLRIGEAGESYALLIAEKLGMDQELIAQARQRVVTTRLPQSQDEPEQARMTPVPAVPAPAPGSTPAPGAGAGTASDPASSPAAGPSAGPVPSPPRPSTEPGSKHDVPNRDKGASTDLPDAGQQRDTYQPGDRVWIHSLKRSAIVKSGPDFRGNLVLITQKREMTINQKRISPYLTREELYPEQYDLDIVLESKDTRRKKKLMSKRHVEGLTIEGPPDNKQ